MSRFGNNSRAPRGSSLAANAARLLFGLILAIAVSEVLLGFLAARHNVPGCQEMRWFRNGDPTVQNAFVLDPVFGFRPRLGTALMNHFGTQVNEYPREKQAGRTRLLFIGDSVVFRGHMVEALRSIYGDREYEYWNAGVESFNTVQEVQFYKAYNRTIQPDHVILSVHNNDFEAVPVAFKHDGKLVVYSTAAPAREANLWLFRKSSTYRFLFGISGLAASGFSVPSPRAVSESEGSLLELRDLLAQDGIRLTAVLLPLCKPYGEWTRSEIRSREASLAMFRKHGLRYFDLLEVAEGAGRKGVRLQEREGDPWHPSVELSELFAEHLRAGRFLEPGDPLVP